MPNERLLDFNPETGEKQWLSTDEEGNSFVRYEQDVEGVLKFNHELGGEGLDKRADQWHVGRYPNSILMEWFTKHGVKFWDPSHADGVKRMLNHPDYARFRSHNFKV